MRLRSLFQRSLGPGEPDANFRPFLEIAADLGLNRLGRAYDRYLSYGVYPGVEAPLYARGIFTDEGPGAVDMAAIAEDHTNARMERRERPHHPFDGATLPDAADEAGHGRAAGLIEAARGAPGHWLRVENGRMAGYQIIAPTTWSFSPRDAAGMPGPLEAAPVRPDETMPVAVQLIVRSFDPCMVCTVH